MVADEDTLNLEAAYVQPFRQLDADRDGLISPMDYMAASKHMGPIFNCKSEREVPPSLPPSPSHCIVLDCIVLY